MITYRTADEHETVRQATRTSTPAERAAVEVVEVKAPGGVPGVVTGIVSTLDDGRVAILMYSARCVHDFYIVPATWVTHRSPDPRP